MYSPSLALLATLTNLRLLRETPSSSAPLDHDDGVIPCHDAKRVTIVLQPTCDANWNSLKHELQTVDGRPLITHLTGTRFRPFHQRRLRQLCAFLRRVRNMNPDLAELCLIARGDAGYYAIQAISMGLLDGIKVRLAVVDMNARGLEDDTLHHLPFISLQTSYRDGFHVHLDAHSRITATPDELCAELCAFAQEKILDETPLSRSKKRTWSFGEGSRFKEYAAPTLHAEAGDD